MSLAIHEAFQIKAAPQDVWSFLIDPAQVVRCLPGAELTDTVDARTYRGRVKIRVGPIATAYDGTAQLTDVDTTQRRMQLVGEGKEVGAAGSARLTLVGMVAQHPDGGSLVKIDATIDIAGRVMQFGRGLVESVSRQLFKQFADAVRSTLESSTPSAPSAASTPPTTVGERVTPTRSGSAMASAPATSAWSTELRIVPLLLRAIVDWFRGLFRRRA